MQDEKLAQLAINTIRNLSMDAVQAAKSGHPGTPMALAPLVYTIWNRLMRFDPQDPVWPNRDRFVLLNGHAPMLLWSILHLTGVQAVNADYETIGHRPEAVQRFRQWRKRWQARAPKAAACLEADLEERLAFFDCPKVHWKRLRTTNVIERLFVEVRRRIRTMCAFPMRSSFERILLAVFDRMNQPWTRHLLPAFAHNS